MFAIECRAVISKYTDKRIQEASNKLQQYEQDPFLIPLAAGIEVTRLPTVSRFMETKIQ